MYNVASFIEINRYVAYSYHFTLLNQLCTILWLSQNWFLQIAFVHKVDMIACFLFEYVFVYMCLFVCVLVCLFVCVHICVYLCMCAIQVQGSLNIQTNKSHTFSVFYVVYYVTH